MCSPDYLNASDVMSAVVDAEMLAAPFEAALEASSLEARILERQARGGTGLLNLRDAQTIRRDSRLVGLHQWGPALERMELFGDAALPILQRELLDEENGPRMLREMRAGVLANVAGEKARPALEQAASSRNRFVARAAREALARLGDK